MKTYFLLLIAYFFSANVNAQTCTPATAPNLVLKNPTYIAGSGTGGGTLNAQYRFANVTNLTPATTDVIVTLTEISNATLTNIDDDISNPATANNFQPVVTINANSTGFIKFSFQFVTVGTTTPFNQNCINFTAMDIDGGPGVQEQVMIENSTATVLGSPTNLTSSTNGNTSTITANNVGCNGICTNPENVANFGKVNSNIVVFTFGAVVTGATSPTRYGSFQFAPYTQATSLTNTLPIRFGTININRIVTGIQVSWSTLLEINIKGFFIERSINGVDFVAVDYTNAYTNQNGANYSRLDNSALATQTYYYRIKIVNNDQKIAYSGIIKSQNLGNTANQLELYPNPVKSSAVIAFALNQTANSKIELYDNSGRLIQNYTLNAKKGNNVFNLTNLENINSGNYIIKLTTQDGIIKTKSFVKY